MIHFFTQINTRHPTAPIPTPPSLPHQSVTFRASVFSPPRLYTPTKDSMGGKFDRRSRSRFCPCSRALGGKPPRPPASEQQNPRKQNLRTTVSGRNENRRSRRHPSGSPRCGRQSGRRQRSSPTCHRATLGIDRKPVTKDWRLANWHKRFRCTSLPPIPRYCLPYPASRRNLHLMNNFRL